MRYIGIDLHHDCFSVHIIDTTKDNQNRPKNYKLDDAGLIKFQSILEKKDLLAVESTTNAFWFREQLMPYCKEVVVLNTQKVHFSGMKTDHIDAKKIAEVLLYYNTVESSTMPSVYVPQKHILELRSLFGTYQLLKKTKNQLSNRISSLFVQNGIKITKKSFSTSSKRSQLPVEKLDDVTYFQVQLLLKQINLIDVEYDEIKRAILLIGFTYLEKEIKLLISIPGFSTFTAIALMSDIGDVCRFSSVKKFCSYLRTAPVIKESNNSSVMKGINKISRPLTCTLLTQSLHHFVKLNSHYMSFHERLKKKKSAGKRRVAIIRKILVSAYYMLKRGQIFRWSDNSFVERKEEKYLIEKRAILNTNLLKFEKKKETA